MSRYSIAIVAPSAIIAEGIKSILVTNACAEAVYTYNSVAELMARLRTTEPDAIIVAARYADELTQYAEAAENTLIGVQCSLSEAEILPRFGVSFNIYNSEEEIVRTVREAIEAPAESSYNESHELSERERDVLVLVARGLTNKEIASELNISPHTVISHRKNIMHKTGIRSVAGLTVYAVLNKLIDSDNL